MQLMATQFPKGLGKFYSPSILPVTEFIANYSAHKAIQEKDNENHAYFVQGGRVIGDLCMFNIRPYLYEAMNRPGVHILVEGRAADIIASLWFVERNAALKALRDSAVNTSNSIKIRVSFQLDPKRVEVLDEVLKYLERRNIESYSVTPDSGMEQSMAVLFSDATTNEHLGGIYTSESHDMWDCVIEFTTVVAARKFLTRMPQVMESLIK